MSANILKDYFLEKLENHDLTGMEGARLACHIPVQENFLNFLMNTLIASPDKMNDFKELHFSEMSDDKFLVKIDHKIIDREIRCKIHEIEYTGHSEREVEIEFLKGIKFYEKVLLGLFGKVKYNWWFFKNALESGEEDESGAFWKLSGSKIKINLDVLLRQQNLAFLVPMVDWKGIITKNNSIIIDFELKTEHHESNYPANN